MKNRKLLLGTLSLSLLLSACSTMVDRNSRPGTMNVQGRHLYTAAGERVILRGVNEMVSISRDRTGSWVMAEIAKTGANSVRIFTRTDFPAADLDKAISNAVANGMIPIPECHDATGKWERLQDCVSYWTRPDVASVIKRHRKWVVLNIANEAGAEVTREAFVAGYRSAIEQIRAAGIEVPLVIDGAGWGQEYRILLDSWKELNASDPRRMVMVSAHSYWIGSEAQRKEHYRYIIEKVTRENIPFILGEGPTPSGYDCTASPYGWALTELERAEIGWLAWSWGLVPNGDCKKEKRYDMTEGGIFGRWKTAAGEQIAISHPASIRNTSRRPCSIPNAGADCAGSRDKPTPAVARPTVRLVPEPSFGMKLKPVPTDVGGRALEVSEKSQEVLVRQWPGTYFRTAFRGTGIYFRVGRGDVSLKVSADGAHVATLVKPAAGLYRVQGLPNGLHSVRVDVVNESQEEPTAWGGFYAPPGAAQRPPMGRTARQIEFIGDSHTVGYGNTSGKRECTSDEVWATTDTSLSPGPVVARRLAADYQVNAISGRGVVRNYNGSPAPTLPEAYPFVLFDREQLYSDPRWRPDLIVISLGTNDFSTALNPGEQWTSRAALQTDFRARYARFVQSLSSKQPQARFVLWSTELADGEITEQVKMVVEALRSQGNSKVVFTEVAGLAMSGCNYHPSTADAVKIADAIAKAADSE